jgi:hypothetical protein
MKRLTNEDYEFNLRCQAGPDLVRPVHPFGHCPPVALRTPGSTFAMGSEEPDARAIRVAALASGGPLPGPADGSFARLSIWVPEASTLLVLEWAGYGAVLLFAGSEPALRRRDGRLSGGCRRRSRRSIGLGRWLGGVS